MKKLLLNFLPFLLIIPLIPLLKTLRNIENNTTKLQKDTAELLERLRSVDRLITALKNF